MALNNAELSVVLKEVIDPEITDQVERTPTLYKLIPKGGDINARTEGGVFMYAKVEPNPSLGWFQEGHAYPTGSNSTRVKFYANFKRVAITSKLTRDVLEGADKSSIINVVTEEIVDDTKSVLKEISQQLYGNGLGTKAVVLNAAYSSPNTTITFKAPFGATQLLNRGTYDFVDNSGNVVTTLTITGKPSATTVTVAGDQTEDVDVDGLKVVSSGSYNECISGLDYHIENDNGTYQGINRANYPTFKAYTLDADGDELSVAILYKAIFQARYARRNNILEGDYVMLSAPTQTHAYALLGDVSSALYTSGSPAVERTGLNEMPNAGSLDYGFRSFKFAGITWIEDVDCPADKLYIINFSKFKIHEFKPLSKVFEGNGFMPIPSFTDAGAGSFRDEVLYTMTWKGQLVCKDPQLAGVKIKNLATGGGLATPTIGFDFEDLLD